MTVIGDKLIEAIEAKNNNVNEFTWKMARQNDGTQEEIKLVDASPEQLQKFYDHCNSMLYSKDKSNPGRYILLDLIGEQRRKCNVELFLRKLESGSICADGKPYPRHLYIQDLRAYINANKKDFPANEWKNISISACTGNLPREFERISIDEVMDGCLDNLGWLQTKHITFSFILSLGIYLTPDELKELEIKDAEGNTRSKLEVLKERLNIKSTVCLTVKPTGLNFNELRAMVNLKSKKYSDLTTDQLTVLRNKVLFKLENKVMYHISQWEEKIEQIKRVADSKGISLTYANF